MKNQSSLHPPQLIALTKPLGRFFFPLTSLSSLFRLDSRLFFLSSSRATLSFTDTLSKLSLRSFFFVLPMLFMSPTNPAFSPSSSLSQSSHALVACCKPYPVVLTLAVRDVCGYKVLSSDGVALLWRVYACVGMCTAGPSGETVLARLDGRVEVRDCAVEGGVVGG